MADRWARWRSNTLVVVPHYSTRGLSRDGRRDNRGITEVGREPIASRHRWCLCRAFASLRKGNSSQLSNYSVTADQGKSGLSQDSAIVDNVGGMAVDYLIEAVVKGVHLRLQTQEGVFSPAKIDKGTQAMLSVVDFEADDRVLDLGCGYGVVGIVAARVIGAANVVMVDIDPLAIHLASKNSVLNGVPDVVIRQSDGFRDLSETGFTKILCNPPYHTDFSVAKHFIEKGFNRLVLGGKMYMVVKRNVWYQNKLISVFGGVRVHEVDGYYVLCSEKRCSQYARKRKGR
jgi:16S rRNA (guanine1207-N2)-methyltransferase